MLSQGPVLMDRKDSQPASSNCPAVSLTLHGACAQVVPHLRAFVPGHVVPCSVVMLDNARIHHAAWPQLEAWCDAAGAKLVPLPPYSPDLNPLELKFNTVRARMQRTRALSLVSPLESIRAAFISTPQECSGYVRNMLRAMESVAA